MDSCISKCECAQKYVQVTIRLCCRLECHVYVRTFEILESTSSGTLAFINLSNAQIVRRISRRRISTGGFNFGNRIFGGVIVSLLYVCT